MDEGQLEAASQAALEMALPTPVATVAPFFPFEVFAWPGSTRAVQAVGSGGREAQDVAWAMTCCAYADSMNEAEGVAKAVAYATHLRREGPIVDKLYKRLAARTGEIVHLEEVEEVLGIRWGEVDFVVDGQARRLDPYFWNMLERTIRNSVADYVKQLDRTLAAVDGLGPLQQSAGACAAMDQVCRRAAACLSKGLLARDVDATRLVSMIQETQGAVMDAHVTAAKAALRQQVAGVRALGMLATAPESELEQRLQELEAPIAEMLAQPPRALEDQLKERRISVLELAAMLPPRSNGLIEPSSRVPPPSLGVRLTVLTRWLDRCKAGLTAACAAATATLQRALDRSSLSTEWAGVSLCIASQTDPRTREAPLGCVARWHPPAHLGDGDDPRVIVAQPDANCSALRAARLFRILLDQVRLGLLPSRSIRADLLIPIVARFTAEGEVAYGQFVDMTLQPMGVRLSLPYADACFGFGGYKRRWDPSPVSVHLGHGGGLLVQAPAPPAMPPPPPPQLAPAAAVTTLLRSQVPAGLLHQHAALHALCMCMQSRLKMSSVRISLGDVQTHLLALAPDMRALSGPAITQLVSFTCRKAVARAVEALKSEGHDYVIEYSSARDRSQDGKVGGVVCEGDGVGYFFDYIAWCVNQMRFHGDTFAREWGVSRRAGTGDKK